MNTSNAPAISAGSLPALAAYLHPQSRSAELIPGLPQLDAALIRPRRELSATTRPRVTLSVVMPAFNVESYIEVAIRSCLDEADHLRSFELLVIDDGSSDATREIIAKIMADDPRVSLLQQDRKGPNAARNLGLAHAAGEFLTFLDGDDVLYPGAYRRALDSLSRTGSDFAIAGYTRIDDTVISPAAAWVARAHARDRLKATVEQEPRILANAVQWTKVYRREFWDEHVSFFSEPGFYQDQLVTARAFGASRRIDIIASPAVAWRRRADGTSMTQQLQNPRNLDDRFRTAFEALSILQSLRGARLATVRLVQYMNNDFAVSAQSLLGAGDDFWETLRRRFDTAARALSSRRVWGKVQPQNKLLIWLILNDRRSDAESFLEQGGAAVTSFPLVGSPALPLVRFPFFDDESIPRWVFRASPGQARRWLLDGRLLSRGRA